MDETRDIRDRAEIDIYANARLDALSQSVGSDLALFYCCAAFDVAFIFDIEANDWFDYVSKVDGRKFIEGETDINVLFKSLLTDEERWAAEWGIGSEEKPYTEKDYRYMDELFKTYSARSIKAGSFDAQVEFNIRSVCRQQLLADKALARGTKEGVDMYTKLTANILKVLESENLRAKDAEKEQSIMLDDIESALQQKYGVGIEMTRDDACRIFHDWQSKMYYNMTEDAVEQAIKIIVNCTRTNNDMTPLEELPKSMAQIMRELPEGMFDAVPSLEENEVYEYLNLKRREVIES